MTTAIIVQARMGSTRLPGKVAMDLHGKTVLAHVLDRCSAVTGADVVVCAMPEEASSRPLQKIADECGAKSFFGSEADVLARYVGAAHSVGADVIMRVTSDCPFIDPSICDAVLELRKKERADYAANNMPASFPHGLDCEAMTIEALCEAMMESEKPYDREHVTPWLRRAEHLVRANLSSGDPALAMHRWTLDFPEDFEFFRAVMAELPKNSPAKMGEIQNVLLEHPALSQINCMHQVQKIK